MLGHSPLPRRRLGHLLSALCALSVAATCSSPAIAQLSWDLRISEKEKQLAYENDPNMVAALAYDNGYTRMWHRNMPTIELTNTSAAGSPDITQFELSVGDLRFNFSNEFFGNYANLGVTTPGFLLSASPAGNDEFDAGDLLTINIQKPGGTGLAVGETVRFQIELGVDPGFSLYSFPDFRTVLFDMNGCNVYDGNVGCGSPDSSDNAEGIAEFANGARIGPLVFEDETVTGNSSIYYNNIFPRHSTSQSVDIFEMGGPSVIPEPSSALLAFAALFGGLLTRRRSRR